MKLTVKEKAQKLHKKVNTFILTCVGEEGYPLAKAVVPARVRDSLNEMYFCTNTLSIFANNVAKNPKASVYFYSRKPIVWQGCLLSGDMQIVEDMAVKQRFWQEKFKGAYEQQSYADPDFCVLKFVPVAGRFYSNYTPESFEI
jgi:general stress protein 26